MISFEKSWPLSAAAAAVVDADVGAGAAFLCTVTSSPSELSHCSEFSDSVFIPPLEAESLSGHQTRGLSLSLTTLR